MKQSKIWGVEEVGGASAVASAEAGDGGKASLLQDVGDAAFQALVGFGPDDFGKVRPLQQVVDVPVELFVATEVAVDSGGDAVQGGADVGVGVCGKVDCA